MCIWGSEAVSLNAAWGLDERVPLRARPIGGRTLSPSTPPRERDFGYLNIDQKGRAPRAPITGETDRPFLALVREGGKFATVLDRDQSLEFASGTDRNRLFHRLEAVREIAAYENASVQYQ